MCRDRAPALSCALLLCLPLLAGCRARPEPADLVLWHGKVVTMSPGAPEAEGIAIRGDTIIATGTDDEVRPFIGELTRVVDLEGRLTLPGFIEGHGHFLGYGRLLRTLDLSATRSWEEVVEAVAAAVRGAAPGERIDGRGWHQDKWGRAPREQVDGYPVHHSLSAVSPENPVVIRHASGHGAMANARAMELAGVGPESSDPEGGKILRGADGIPTGMLFDTAERLVAPGWDEAVSRHEAELASRALLAHGITSFQDASSNAFSAPRRSGQALPEVELLRRMAVEGALGVRLWEMLEEPYDVLVDALPRYRVKGLGYEHLTVGAIKVSLDGAMGTRTAWLLEPYSDRPKTSGLQTFDLEELEKIAELAVAHEVQLGVHAIGDRAVREALDLYERVFAAHPGRRDLRWRIEHAQNVAPQDLPRFAELGVIAAVQGVHCTSDGSWVGSRLGSERTRLEAYPWRSLLDSGAVVINGTDVPIEDPSPIANFYASVTRRLADGTSFHPEQRMTRMEALRSMTATPAWAAFEEDRKGTLEAGKLADVVVLSRDLLTVPEEEIPGTEVVYTIVGGVVRYAQ